MISAVKVALNLNTTDQPMFVPSIVATDEVVVYGTNIENYSNDAFLAFPTDVLGTEYYAVCHYPTYTPNEFMVIGK